MARPFVVPNHYQSQLVGKIKRDRLAQDAKRKDLSPTIINCGTFEVSLARHFGFCYGVEHAIEVAYRALEENPGANIYLLSEIIHNPEVNRDLTARGIRFLQDTSGN